MLDDATVNEMEQSSSLNNAVDGDIDTEADVIIKAESHFNSNDLQEELDLLETGQFDAVVLEMDEESALQASRSTFQDCIVGFPLFLFQFVYTSVLPLIATAAKQNVDITFTRETDANIINELPGYLPGVVQGIVISLIIGVIGFSALAVMYTDVWLVGLSLICYLCIVIIPIVIRQIRGRMSGEQNRNELMAQSVTQVIQDTDGGRVLFPVGADHASPVSARLPSNIESDTVPVANDFFGFVEILLN